jgi:hypothetical protein
MPQNKFPAIAVAVFALFITYLHYSSMGTSHTLHNIYRELYYIPGFFGALAYGLKGAASIAVNVTVLSPRANLCKRHNYPFLATSCRVNILVVLNFDHKCANL